MLSQAVDTHSLHENLKIRWDSLWDRFHLIPRTGLFETIISRWSESHRHYHTTYHLFECLNALDEISLYTEDCRPIEFALWYHDIFHNVGMQSNEEKSAQLALSSFVKSGGDSTVGLRIRDLIMSTSHRDPIKTCDAAIIVDVDLWILGSSSDRFDQYEKQVRSEYPQMNDLFFAQGRTRLLKKFSEKKFIYRTPLFRSSREDVARDNIDRSLRYLAKFM